MEWTVFEANTTFLEGFSLQQLPDSLPSQIRVVRSKGRIGFEVGNITGIVPLGNGNSLRIIPKYKGINIVDMMLYVQGVDNKLNHPESAKQYGLGDGVPKGEVFVGTFIKELRVIEERSLKFERKKERIDINYVKGSVNWVKTALNTKRGVSNPVATKVHFSNYHIPENRILGAAAKKCMSYVEKYSDDWNLLFKWAERFGDVPHEELFHAVDKKLLQDRIGGARAYYFNAIVIAKLILGYYGMTAGEDIDGNALLVNTPTLYEEFVRIGCQNILKPRGVFVSKGFTPIEFLFDNGTCEVIPDLVFWNNNHVILVADVKYKEPDSKDYYQMFTYTKKAGVKVGVIFTPCKNGENEPDITSRNAFDGTVIYVVTVPTHNTKDLENTLGLLCVNGLFPL